MRKTIAAAFALTMTVAVGMSSALAKDVIKEKGGSATLIPAANLKWTDVPGFAGVQMAVLQGDPGKGAHHAMLKLPGGFTAPLHHHTADHYVTVVAGTVVLTVDGRDTRLPAGSYFSFTGKKQHLTRCDAGADCILSSDARKAWDVLPEKAQPTAKK